MKIEIGPYVNWFGPYQLSDLLFKRLLGQDKAHAIGDWLDKTWIKYLLQYLYDKRERTVKVQIDHYDTWNMDGTLSLIVAPMLRQLKETKAGSPYTDDEDVPEYLRSTAAKPKKNEWDTDSNWHDRWAWILGEMLWAFEQVEREALGGPAWDDKFMSGNLDINWEDDEVVIDGKPAQQAVRGPNDTFKIDKDARDAHYKRMSNGFRLFGKYYMGLWD